MEGTNKITLEGVLAGFDAMLAKSAAEFDRKLEQSRAAFDLKMQESRVAFDLEMQESRADFDLKMQDLRESQAETDKEIKQVNKQIGGMGNSQGKATTELFFNSLKYGSKKMFGEAFDDVFKEESRQTNKGFEDEYDILLFNGQAVCIVEVKYKADSNDVPQVLRKEKTFRANFPEHNHKRLYLALASSSFHPLTEKACKEHGIAIMKQVGDTVAIYDENLKTF